jgi:hypothetical protein
MKKTEKLVHKKKENTAIAAFSEFGFNTQENLEGVEARLPQIDIAHSAQAFKFPDGRKQDELVGIIVDSNRVNVYWEAALNETGAGKSPDCFSFDGVVPNGEKPKFANCAGCSYNKFGSEKAKTGKGFGREKAKTGKGFGRGKACKNKRRIHILFKDKQLPYRLTIPSTSLRSWEDYMIALSESDRPYMTVVTKISLSAEKNKDNIEFSRVEFEMVSPLDLTKDRELLLRIRDMRLKLKETMKAQEITPDEAHDKDPF